MIAGFGTINGHVGGMQCHVAGTTGLPPVTPPQITTQATAAATTEFTVHSNLCLHFQTQHYVANTTPTSGVVGGVAMGTNALPTPPQMPLPQVPATPLPQPAVIALPQAPAMSLPQSPVMHLPQPVMATPTAAAATKPGQGGGFRKVCRVEEASPCPFPGLAPGVLHMRVKEGSKIRNLMGFAMARMQRPSSLSTETTGTGAHGPFNRGTGMMPGSSFSSSSLSSSTGLRQVVFSGSGRAVTKTITCAEIMKRKLGGLHQLTKLSYKGVQEVWESQDSGGVGGSGGGGGGGGGSSSRELTVHRTVPSISILLSKDPLDPLEPGYQPPETLSALWAEREEQSPPLHCVPVKRAVLKPPPHAPHTGQPSTKRLCVGAGVPLRCPAD